MAVFPFSTIERSLQQGARANAAAAVLQNRLLAEQKRQAAEAQARSAAAHRPAATG